MSTGRKRKKAARQQSLAQWRATAAVAPQRNGDPHSPAAAAPATTVTATATRPLTRPDAADEPVATSPEDQKPWFAAPAGIDERVAPPAGDRVDPFETPLEDRVDHDRYQHDDVDGYQDDDGDGHDESTRPSRRRVVAVAVAAPLMFAGAFFAGGWVLNQIQDEPQGVGLTAAPPPTSVSASVPVAPPQSSAGSFVPGGVVGPGLTEPGALVRATPTADGALEVVERVRFAEPVSELLLGLPLTKGVAARSLPGEMEVTDLQVQADDDVVDVGSRGLTTSRTIDLPGDTSTLVMRYRLTGATVRSIPSTPGRALTVLPPITSPTTLGSMPFVIEVSGAELTNVLCPGLPTAVQLCGRTWTQGWYTPPQQAGRTAVVAQLLLPEPVGS